MKRWLCLMLACCLMLLSAAQATEDVCYIADVAHTEEVTTGCSYLRLNVPVTQEAGVTLTITGESGATVYSRDFGVRADAFRTEDIYLKLKGARTVYTVTLQVGDRSYAFPVERVAGRISGGAACTAGYPLSDMTGRQGWQTATLLPAAEGVTTVPVYAAGAYVIGSATFTVSEGSLTVSVAMDEAADGAVDSARVFIATSAEEAAQLGKNKFPGLTGRLDKAIPLGGAEVLAVYVKLSVSFEPASAAHADEVYLDGQEALWLQLLEPIG